MMTNTAPPCPNESKISWVDKVISIVEKLSLFLMAIPFGSMALWAFSSTFLEGDYFFFFPTAMFLFFPTGVFALLVQIFRIIRKRPANSFNRFMLAGSILTVVIGIFACMAIFVVTS